MAHVHSHGSTVDVPLRVRRILFAIAVPIVVATVFGIVVLRSPMSNKSTEAALGQPPVTADAIVTAASSGPCDGGDPLATADTPAGIGDPFGGIRCQKITIRVTSGRDKDAGSTFDYQATTNAAELKLGDRIVVAGYSDGTAEGTQYSFIDFQRRTPLILLAVIFVAAVLILGRGRGLRALIALIASLGMIVWFTIPAVVNGKNPLGVSIVTAVAVMLVVLYLTDGFNARATTAVLGTVASLGLIAVLAVVFVDLARLTGLASEEAGFIQAVNGSSINIQGLLLGGFIIGALGVLDDMTVTQVSAVWELHHANPGMGTAALYKAAERIGRDHIGSTVNTLVLAYAGASLPLLILFTQSSQSLWTVLTSEVVAVEIVRTLVGSIGLVASVPITTALAAVVVTSGDGGFSWRSLRSGSNAMDEPVRPA